jgi:hypothetical protein
MNPLAGWDNFYVIVGSSAGALIGLQFVVITLIASRPVGAGTQQAGAAFATPTIVHFGAALLLSAIINAPFQHLQSAAMVWGALGAIGILYQLVVLRRMRSQGAYSPELEDWMFHVVLPFAAYGTLAGSAYTIRMDAADSLFAVAAATLLLLIVGIHNAWDAVTYHIFAKKDE